MVVCPLHRYYDELHLEHVAQQMETRGPPVLRGAIVGELVLLREGTHRIRAASRLGLVPIIVPIRWWRTRAALARAHFSAARYGLTFERIEVRG